jgi:hypothetical protein
MESLDKSVEGVIKVLKFRNRNYPVTLLRRARLEMDVSDNYGSLLYSLLTTALFYCPIEDCDRLRALPKEEKDQILSALREIHPPRAHDIEITKVDFRVDPSEPSATPSSSDLIKEIEEQRNLMVSVATGGPRIESVNQDYQERRTRIGTWLQNEGLKDPNPFGDLWGWYAKWSSGGLPTYQSRRKFISDLYAPLIERLNRGNQGRGAEIFEEPTGWTKVDRAIGEVRTRVEGASTEEQFQAVGLLCRETLISLSQIVYEPDRHRPIDGVQPSATDAKRMLENYLASELAGGSNKIARQHAKAALDLANELQHKRTATFREAALCAEATASVVNLIAIISGQRDPRSK